MNLRHHRRSSYHAIVIGLVLACCWPTLTLRLRVDFMAEDDEA